MIDCPTLSRDDRLPFFLVMVFDPDPIIAVVQATIVHLLGDAVFMGCLGLWIKMAAFADDFELSPILISNDATKQVLYAVQVLSLLTS